MRVAFAVILVCGLVALANDPVGSGVTVIPRPESGKAVEVKAVKDKINKFKPDGSSKEAKWTLIDKEYADLEEDGLVARFVASKDGTYRAVVATLEDGKLSQTVVLIKVGDNPGPPPKPPEPKPPEPPPSSPLKDRLTAAFAADAAQLDVRRAGARKLASLYRGAADLVVQRSDGMDPSAPYFVLTTGELLRAIKQMGGGLLQPTELVALRKQIAVELVGTEAAPGPLANDEEFSDGQRKAAEKLFREIAAVLEAL